MSATSKRRRRRTASKPTAETAPEARTAPSPPPLPEWRWRTFPVFFAFAFGLFLGTYLALIGSALGSGGVLIVFVVAALLMGLALSRVTTRWLLQRRWIKPRPRKR